MKKEEVDNMEFSEAEINFVVALVEESLALAEFLEPEDQAASKQFHEEILRKLESALRKATQ